MTLGGVARVAMEYRQHLAMLTNISKLSSAMDGGGGKMMLSNNGANGGNGGDTFTCEFFPSSQTLSCLVLFLFQSALDIVFRKHFHQLTAATVRLLLLLLMFNSFEFFNFNFSLYRIADDNC